MSEDTMTTEPQAGMPCPKDGMAMAAVGRRSGAYRCPTCKGMFLDVETMRRGRAGQPPTWAPFVMSVLMSVAMTMLVRRLRRRSERRSQPSTT